MAGSGMMLPKCNRLLLMLTEYRRIQSELSLCKAPSSAEDIYQLNGLLRNAFTMMAMLDYPYSTHFMGNMPANPVKVDCTQLGSDTVQQMLLSGGPFQLASTRGVTGGAFGRKMFFLMNLQHVFKNALKEYTELLQVHQ